MAKIRRGGKKEMPAINTSSLPDIIFMLLFFFMTVTSMKEVTYKVQMSYPEATELEKMENKSLVRYIYVGQPTKDLIGKYGSDTRIQLDDAFADISEVENYAANERAALGEEGGAMTINIKADKDTRMGVISDIKQALRRANTLKIIYAAMQRTSY